MLKELKLHPGAYVFLIAMTPRSQTYSANEVDLILAVSETDETIEWVDIDPAAFTGTVHPYSTPIFKTPLQLIMFPPFREW